MRCITRGPLLVAALLLAGSIASSAGPDTSQGDRRLLQGARLGTDGPALLDYFRKRVVADLDANQIRALIKDLGNDSFELREKASTVLVKLGMTAEPYLEQAQKNPDVEVVRRSQDCLRLMRTGPDTAVDTAALRLLAQQKPAGAAEVVIGFLPFAGGPLIAEEARTTLTAVALRDGQPDAAIVAALADKSPQRRAAAAVALSRAGTAEQRKPVHRLLQDSDLSVRLDVALALAEARDKDAVPVLIDLLPQLSLAQAWQAEDMLFRVAGDQPPKASLLSDESSRKKARDAWSDWWAKNKDRIDLSGLVAQHRVLGYTTVILLDSHIVQELDDTGKHYWPLVLTAGSLGQTLSEIEALVRLRWRLKDIQFPLDAQLLPGERILLAEHGANKVTERSLKDGKVLWEKDLAGGPLVVQRLGNGNTFISTDREVLEVDRDGKEVLKYSRPLETIRKAMRLRNGDIALVTSAQRYIRLSPELTELRSFEADVRTNGGRIDVLANGHVLIPLKDANRVIECTGEGKVVWEAAVDEPIAAVRLPNGHTLVNTLNQRRAIELDGAGREVWEYRSTESRVTRAWRR